MPDRKPIIVLDPGHGGNAAVGGSSPNNATGPNGLLEKNLTLDLARRLQALLAATADVSMTRTADTNLSLAARAQLARDRHADIFLSLHFNGFSNPQTDGTEVWVARQSNSVSRALAQTVLRHLAAATGVANRGVREGDLGVLLPARHASNTAACLAEAVFLTNPAEARRLESESYRQQLATALAEAIAAHLHEVRPTAAAHAVWGGALAREGAFAGAQPDYETAGWGAALSGTSLSRNARLEWQDLTLTPDSRGQNTLFLLTTGSPEGGPAIFNLKITNTNTVYNFKNTMLKVRLRRKEADGTFRTIPLHTNEGEPKCASRADVDEGYKCLHSREIEDETSHTIPLRIERDTLLRAYDPNNQFMRLEADFHWSEEGITGRHGRDFYYNHIDRGFYLVQPVEIFYGSRQFVRDIALSDPQYREFWTPVWEHEFTANDQFQRTVTLNTQTAVSQAATNEITVSRSVTTTKGEQHGVESTYTASEKASFGLDEVVKLGLETQESVSVKTSASWNSSVARQVSDAVRTSRTFTESFSSSKTITTFITPAAAGKRKTLYLYPVFKLYKVKVVRFEGPNRYGQATGRTELNEAPILLFSHWGDKQVETNAGQPRARGQAFDTVNTSYSLSADEWNPIIRAELAGYLNRFANIPVTVGSATVNVRPPYFINRDNERKRRALENRRNAPAEDRAIFEDRSFAAARIGKGTIEQYTSILQRAVAGRRVQAGSGRTSPNAEDLRGWLVRYGLGIDCSGFVTQALNAAMQRVFGRNPNESERLDPLNVNSAALKGGSRGFSAIARPDQLRPGDTMHKEGHIRVITRVEVTGEGHVKFMTAESSSAQDVGPTPNVWRYQNREHMTGLQKEANSDWDGAQWRNHNEGTNTYGRYQPLSRFVDANSPARTAQPHSLGEYYEDFGYATPLQQQPRIGWPDARGGSPNAGETVVNGLRRIPLADLQRGNQERAPRDGISESAAGRAIVLIPSELDRTRTVEILLHLHGYNIGYRTPGSGRPRDIDVDQIPQQVASSRRNLIVVLPQGTMTSGFGALDINAYLDEIFSALNATGVWRGGAPQRGGVILSGHSGGGGPIAGILNEAGQPRLPRNLGGLFLFDAINVRSGRPVSESGELRAARAWVAGRLQQDLGELQRRSDPAAQRGYVTSSLRLRGYHTPGHYANLYSPLSDDIARWFNAHQRELQSLDQSATQRLRENYRLTPVATLIPQGQSPNHDRILALGHPLQDALAALPAAAPASSQAYAAATDNFITPSFTNSTAMGVAGRL